MTARVLAETAGSISELKKNPMQLLRSGDGFPVAVLNRNEPVFYCVPADAYAALLDRLEDLELAQLAHERAAEREVEVSLHEL